MKNFNFNKSKKKKNTKTMSWIWYKPKLKWIKKKWIQKT